MDLLVETNIAYLVLLAGALFSLMAIVTPGSGIFEVAALFFLALAGYAVYNLQFSWWALSILVLSVVPFWHSLRAPRREPFLALSLVMLVVGSVFLFDGPDGAMAVHPTVATVASVLVGAFLWVAVRKSVQASQTRPAHGLEMLVGAAGESKTVVGEEGSVQVAGELWSARSSRAIPAGMPVRVVGREGFVLIVEEAEETAKVGK